MEKKYIEAFKKIFVPVDVRALAYAKKVHAGEKRHDGSDYINHPIRVAGLVEKYMSGTNIRELKAAAYLHDTIENTSTTYQDLVELFDYKIASIVLELTTDEELKNEVGKTRYLEIKMKNMSDFALFLKLCDRYDNLSDMKMSSPKFINAQIDSTIQILTSVIKHRRLTDVHYEIMEDIFDLLFYLTAEKEEKKAIVTNLLSLLNYLKNNNKKYIDSLARIRKLDN